MNAATAEKYDGSSTESASHDVMVASAGSMPELVDLGAGLLGRPRLVGRLAGLLAGDVAGVDGGHHVQETACVLRDQRFGLGAGVGLALLHAEHDDQALVGPMLCREGVQRPVE